MKKVLFVSTSNSCRGPMAEGFLRHLGSEQYEVFSAGTKPSRVSRLAVRVMEEAGIDISSQESKSVEDLKNQAFDFIVTVCDNVRHNCPVFPGEGRRVHWDLEDPAEAEGAEDAKLEIFRMVRDQIEEDVLDFLDYEA
jgi:arsenate reductase (thioredoxin)